MENQQLLDYVKQQLQQGADRETIKTFLTAQGEQEQAINEAFQAATPVFVAFLKKKKWKKIVLIIAGVIILLVTTVIFLPGVLGLFAKDVPPIPIIRPTVNIIVLLMGIIVSRLFVNN